MSDKDRRHLGEGPMFQSPRIKLNPKLADHCIKKKHLSDEVSVQFDRLFDKTKDLQNQIESAEIGGFAVSNTFGENSHVGMSQKALTDAINKIWSKIEDITGESILGFQMDITPEYYIGEEGCNIHVTANTVETAGVFEEIAFYINGQLINHGENVDYMEFDTEINETSIVKCVAKILGVEYEKQAIITHYSSFWLGAGSSYTGAMKNANLRPITNGMRGAYNITVAEGEYIFVIVGESLREGFIRADINGVEIAFNETTVTVDGNRYRVLKSENTYQAGTYNIDING